MFQEVTMSYSSAFLHLRYVGTQRQDAYGRMVFKHLAQIRTQLQGHSKNKRNGWLRLLKDICDYVALTENKKVDEKKGDGDETTNS